MSRSPRVATDRGLGFEWWYVVAIGSAIWVLFFATVDLEGATGRSLVDTLALLAVLAWPAIPVALYLDLRATRDALAWEPATRSWLLVSLVPLVNGPAGVAYCLRRRAAVRGELPSPSWRYAVYLGLVAWLVLVAADVAVDTVDLGVLEPLVFGPLLTVALFGFPVAVYLDVERARHITDLSPNVRALVVLSAIPLLNLLVVTIYAAVRWWHRRGADTTAEPTLPGSELERADRPAPVSPWYRRAAGVFLVYFLLVVAIGAGLSIGSDLAWGVMSLLVWLAFGLPFVVCFHRDCRVLREAGVPWGPTRFLYYSSAVFPGPAFWYLLSRLTKVNRARRRGLLDDADEADPGIGHGASKPGSGTGDNDAGSDDDEAGVVSVDTERR